MTVITAVGDLECRLAGVYVELTGLLRRAENEGAVDLAQAILDALGDLHAVVIGTDTQEEVN